MHEYFGNFLLIQWESYLDKIQFEWFTLIRNSPIESQSQKTKKAGTKNFFSLSGFEKLVEKLIK